MDLHHTLFSHLKKDEVQLALSLGSILTLIANVWMATKLYPLVEADLRLGNRIEAVETRVLVAEAELASDNAVAGPLMERFYKLEQSAGTLEQLVMEIRQDVKGIDRDVEAIKGALLR